MEDIFRHLLNRIGEQSHETAAQGPEISAQQKIDQAKGTTYQCTQRFRFPCAARPAIWFTTRRSDIRARADSHYAENAASINKKAPDALKEWTFIVNVPDEARQILLDRVITDYMAMIAKKETSMLLKLKWCFHPKNCSLMIYQRFIVQSIRELIREEENENKT
jgi:hypothetical protein